MQKSFPGPPLSSAEQRTSRMHERFHAEAYETQRHFLKEWKSKIRKPSSTRKVQDIGKGRPDKPLPGLGSLLEPATPPSASVTLLCSLQCAQLCISLAVSSSISRLDPTARILLHSGRRLCMHTKDIGVLVSIREGLNILDGISNVRPRCLSTSRETLRIPRTGGEPLSPKCTESNLWQVRILTM